MRIPVESVLKKPQLCAESGYVSTDTVKRCDAAIKDSKLITCLRTYGCRSKRGWAKWRDVESFSNGEYVGLLAVGDQFHGLLAAAWDDQHYHAHVRA